MNPIQDLKTEHQAVLATLKVLDTIAGGSERSGTIERPEHVEQLIEFFKVFVDRCHHGKEEELLFPALEQIGVSRDGGPIGVMLREHEEGRRYVAAMNKSLSALKAGRPKEVIRDFARQAKGYSALLKAHIDKEDAVLFKIAAERLPAEKLDELGRGFEYIEANRIGAGRHEAFHRMIDDLERTYRD